MKTIDGDGERPRRLLNRRDTHIETANFAAVAETIASFMFSYIDNAETTLINELHRIWFLTYLAVIFLGQKDDPGDIPVAYDEEGLSEGKEELYEAAKVAIINAWSAFAVKLSPEIGVVEFQNLRAHMLFSIGNKLRAKFVDKAHDYCKKDRAVWIDLDRAFVLSFWRDFAWPCLAPANDALAPSGIRDYYCSIIADPAAVALRMRDPIPDLLGRMSRGRAAMPFETFQEELDPLGILSAMAGSPPNGRAPFIAMNPYTGLPVSREFQDYLDQARTANREEGAAGKSERFEKCERWLSLKLFYLDALCDLSYLAKRGYLGKRLLAVLDHHDAPRQELAALLCQWEDIPSQYRQNNDTTLRNAALALANHKAFPEIESLARKRSESPRKAPIDFSEDTDRRWLPQMLALLALHGAHLYLTFTNGKNLASIALPHCYATAPRHFDKSGSASAVYDEDEI